MYVYVKSSNSHVAGGIWTEEKEKRSKSFLNNPPITLFLFVQFLLTIDTLIDTPACMLIADSFAVV
jgi:hypothetical protein